MFSYVQNDVKNCVNSEKIKLKEVTQVYRTLVNQLIDGYEKLAYQQKERFIEALPKIMEAVIV